LAHGAGAKARNWVESKGGEVQDLEFQIKALRGQLEQREAAYDQKRAQTEATLRARGQEIEQLEQRLIQIAGAFVAPLRQNPGLADLFVQLERAG
jgi:small-conductance mechanosensitive channel